MAEPRNVEVTLDDQTDINTFNKLNADFHMVKAQIESKEKEAEHLEEAQNELMLAEDEAARYLVGECFMHISNEDADEKLASELEGAASLIAELKSREEELTSQMNALKEKLYGKFGNSINLEE